MGAQLCPHLHTPTAPGVCGVWFSHAGSGRGVRSGARLYSPIPASLHAGQRMQESVGTPPACNLLGYGLVPRHCMPAKECRNRLESHRRAIFLVMGCSPHRVARRRRGTRYVRGVACGAPTCMWVCDCMQMGAQLCPHLYTTTAPGVFRWSISSHHVARRRSGSGAPLYAVPLRLGAKLDGKGRRKRRPYVQHNSALSDAHSYMAGRSAITHKKVTSTPSSSALSSTAECTVRPASRSNSRLVSLS